VRWLLAAIALGGCGDEPPITALALEVTGTDYQWTVRYPGPDGRLHSDDDVIDRRDLHLPAGADVTITLGSTDFVYRFGLPDYGIRAMAVPDVPFSVRFTPTVPGVGRLLGDEMCGYAHPSLIGKVYVEPSATFRRWLRDRSG
jgi:cytochrome c oxidase subunit 2